MIHIAIIKFCRTLKNFFGEFVWIEKKISSSSKMDLVFINTRDYVPTVITF